MPPSSRPIRTPKRDGRGIRSILLLTAALLFYTSAQSHASSISIESAVDRSTITVGDLVAYTLTLRRGARDQVEKPPMAINLGQFEIRDYRVLEPRRMKDGRIEEKTEYLITAYKTGDYEIPPVTVKFVTAGGDTGRISSEKIAIKIESVKLSEAGDIKDIKPPVEIPGDIPIWTIALIGVVLISGIALAFYLWRRKRKELVALEPPSEPMDYLAEFDRIGTMGLLERGAYKEYYTLLSETLRRYLGDRFGIEAMERTTYEICQDIPERAIPQESPSLIESFLSQCDLVKFAKFSPSGEEMQEMPELGKRIVSMIGETAERTQPEYRPDESEMEHAVQPMS